MYKKILILALLLFPSVVLATSGPYIKAEAGLVSSHLLFGDNPDGFGGRIAAGYLFGQTKFNYGIESGALIYPHLSGQEHTLFGDNYADIVIEGYGIDLLGVLKYTFDSNFVIFAKGGAAYNHQEFTKDYSSWTSHIPKDQYTYNSVRPELALGTGYQFSPCTEVDLTASIVTTPEEPTTTLLLGFSYSF